MDNSLISASYIPSRLQLAYMFTKRLHREWFHDPTCKLGMINIHSPGEFWACRKYFVKLQGDIVIITSLVL